LTLQGLSENIAHLSSGHLARLFRTKKGKSFTDYLREVRLGKAAELLRQTSFSIGNIASLVGYGDVSNFSQQFRRFFGISPTEYRTQSTKSQK
jgi:two-component system response regulator YesN